MALGQGLRHPIDEGLVVEQRVDPAERRIPELVGVRQECRSTSMRLRCRYARRTTAPPARPVRLRGCTA